MTPDIVLDEAPDPAARDAILRPLIASNVARAGPHGLHPLALLIKDPHTAEVLGGLWGRTSYGWLFVELLFVPESLRGSGLGASLMRRA